MSFIIKQGGYIYFDLFVGLKVQLMQYEEYDIKNPVHSLLCIISFSRIDGSQGQSYGRALQRRQIGHRLG